MQKLYQNRHAVTDSIISIYDATSLMELRAFKEDMNVVRPKHKEVLYMHSILTIEDCTATDLCKLFDESKAMVSQTLNGMEKKGFITREKDPNDRRRHFIRVTQKKIDEMNIEVSIIDNTVDDVLKKYSKEEVDKAAKILAEISSRLKESQLD